MSTTVTVLIVLAIALGAVALTLRVGRLALLFTALALVGLLIWYVIEDDLDPQTRDAVVEGADAIREGAGVVRREVVEAVKDGAERIERGIDSLGDDEPAPGEPPADEAASEGQRGEERAPDR